MAQDLTFNDVLEAADHLSHDEQQELINILHRRLAEAARQRLIADVHESRQQFENGQGIAGTPDEIMREIGR